MAKTNMNEIHRQCTFESGNYRTVAWIPERGAKLGYSMKFKDDTEGFEGRVWTVIGVSGARKELRYLRDRERGSWHDNDLHRRGKS